MCCLHCSASITAALLQHILNGLQPRFAAVRGEKDTAEQIAAGLATQAQNLQRDLQVPQDQHEGLTGLMHTLQGQNTVLTRNVEDMQEHQGHLTRRVLQLEDQNVTLGDEAASLQKRLDATYLEQQEYVTAIERLQMEKEALRCKVADQEQRMAAQVQKLEAQEQHVREQGEAVKGQKQQAGSPPAALAPSLPHLAQLHSQYGFCHVFHFCLQFHDSYLRLKDEQQGKAAAVMVSPSTQQPSANLHTIGGLPALLSLLQGSHASIRWRAAEVVATCVQNNPPVQQWFIEGALLALSCLIRLNPLALEVFRQKRGIPKLIQAADDQDIKVQRKALHLLRHVVHAHPPDAVVACQLGAVHQAASHLASSDTDTWQAALAPVQQLAEDSQSAQILQQDKQLQHQLQSLQAKLQGLTCEDEEATEEEMAVCKQLMHSLYNTSSQSACMPQTQPSRPQATAAAVANGAPRLPQAQSPGHGNSSLSAAPLLLGPPSQS
ncbi:TPA: hypothetical protein ACH3X2_004434 [Trebouxia sp. C0005]